MRQSLSQAVKDFNETFSGCFEEISKSMSDLSKGQCSSMKVLSRASSSQIETQHHPNQNIFYQQHNAPGYNSLPHQANQQVNFIHNVLMIVNHFGTKIRIHELCLLKSYKLVDSVYILTLYVYVSIYTFFRKNHEIRLQAELKFTFICKQVFFHISNLNG